MALTLEQILENENIKADRFGMAAISYIFKAFGDNIRSKEYWPWGDKVDFQWKESEGSNTDLTNANLCIIQSQIRSREEQEEKIKQNNSNSIKDLKKRLDKINMSVNSANKLTKNINKTNTDYQEKNININIE